MPWIKNGAREPALLILVLIFLLLFPPLFRPVLHGADTVGYYAWIRSAAIDRTLDVRNTFYHYSGEFGERHRERDINLKTASGYTYNQWAAGSSILWAPGFLIAHAAVKTSRAFGASIQADGFSWPYPLAASLSTALFGLFGLCMTYSIARHLAGRFPAGLAVIVVWLATPMVFYMYSHPLMSHVNDAFVNALFVYVWWKTRDSYSTKAGLMRGLAAGLAIWVRTQDAVLILILGLETFADLVIFFRNKNSLKPVFYRSLATLTGYLVLFVPLLIFWRVVFGSWMMNTYSVTQGTFSFDWRGIHIFNVLFSSNRGLFIWAPITLPSLIGLRWLFKENARLAVMLACMFAAQLYVVSSWLGWSGNIAFGPRIWVAQTVIFALGLAALAKAMRGPMILHAAVGGAFILWNFLLIVQYVLETIPRRGPVDLGSMIRNQFMIIPENLHRILQSLMNRGR